jgi:hypothetical protein
LVVFRLACRACVAPHHGFDTDELNGEYDEKPSELRRLGRRHRAASHGAWAEADSGPVDARPGQWWAVLPLWTRGQGMSDLCLEATITEAADRVVVVIDTTSACCNWW